MLVSLKPRPDFLGMLETLNRNPADRLVSQGIMSGHRIAGRVSFPKRGGRKTRASDVMGSVRIQLQPWGGVPPRPARRDFMPVFLPPVNMQARHEMEAELEDLGNDANELMGGMALGEARLQTLHAEAERQTESQQPLSFDVSEAARQALARMTHDLDEWGLRADVLDRRLRVSEAAEHSVMMVTPESRSRRTSRAHSWAGQPMAELSPRSPVMAFAPLRDRRRQPRIPVGGRYPVPPLPASSVPGSQMTRQMMRSSSASLSFGGALDLRSRINRLGARPASLRYLAGQQLATLRAQVDDLVEETRDFADDVRLRERERQAAAGFRRRPAPLQGTAPVLKPPAPKPKEEKASQ